MLHAANADIEFENLDFNYGEKPVLHNINLTVKAGQLVALVGASGSGKTTLANLLLRFYDPARGAIKIGGVDLRDVSTRDLRNQIAVVTQETILFNDTIRRNIELGRLGATNDEIIAAARHAYAYDFIMQKPEGFDAVIGEKGVSLSGGQRQRLAIARAVLKNAPILVLDEATSALDTESERAVQAALDELMKGRTTICIAHRLSTILHADVIVVLDQGRIVETGTARGIDPARRHLPKTLRTAICVVNARPEKILALQFKYFGDAVLMTPALRAIREHFPNGELHLLVPEEVAPLFQHLPWLNRVWPMPRRRGSASLGQTWPVIRALRRERFDRSVDFASNDRGAILSFLIGARRRLGWAQRGGFFGRRFCYNQRVAPETKLAARVGAADESAFRVGHRARPRSNRKFTATRRWTRRRQNCCRNAPFFVTSLPASRKRNGRSGIGRHFIGWPPPPGNGSPLPPRPAHANNR